MPDTAFIRPASMPDAIAALVADWITCIKSPFSDSFYSMPGVTWDFKPDGCLRASDHWAFRSKRDTRLHCVPANGVPPPGWWGIARHENGAWNLLTSAAPIRTADPRLRVLQAALALGRSAWGHDELPGLRNMRQSRLLNTLNSLYQARLVERYALTGRRSDLIPLDAVEALLRTRNKAVFRLSAAGRAAALAGAMAALEATAAAGVAARMA